MGFLVCLNSFVIVWLGIEKKIFFCLHDSNKQINWLIENVLLAFPDLLCGTRSPFTCRQLQTLKSSNAYLKLIYLLPLINYFLTLLSCTSITSNRVGAYSIHSSGQWQIAAHINHFKCAKPKTFITLKIYKFRSVEPTLTYRQAYVSVGL